VPVAQFRKAQERLNKPNPRWDRKGILKSLQGLLAQKGHLSGKVISQSKGAPRVETIINHFGSLYAAYAAVGYSPPPIPPFGMNEPHWSRKEILAGLKKLHADRGYISNRLIDSCPELPSNVLIRRRFGSTHEAMRQAGLPVFSHSQNQRRMWKRRKDAGYDQYYHGVRWTDAELLEALRRVERQFGYTSAKLLDQNGATPSAYFFAKRFGSLTKARASAGLPVKIFSEIMVDAFQRKKEGKTIRRQQRHGGQRPRLWYRSDEILVGLKRLAKREGAVSARLIDEDAGLPSWATVVKHFGSLRAAYQLAGLVRLNAKPERFGPPPQK
jgi:hypothetical protein